MARRPACPLDPQLAGHEVKLVMEHHDIGEGEFVESDSGLNGLARSSKEITPGTTTRITTSKIAYLVRLIAKGKAVNVIITTTGLKFG